MMYLSDVYFIVLKSMKNEKNISGALQLDQLPYWPYKPMQGVPAIHLQAKMKSLTTVFAAMGAGLQTRSYSNVMVKLAMAGCHGVNTN